MFPHLEVRSRRTRDDTDDTGDNSKQDAVEHCLTDSCIRKYELEVLERQVLRAEFRAVIL